MDIALIALLTFVGSFIGTLTGFGTSTVMVPVLVMFYPLPQALLLVGIIHWFGDIWKMLLFRSGVRWRLVLLFGVPGIIATVAGGLLVFQAPQELLSRILGAFLLAYVAFILVNRRFKVPQTTATALTGGALYGLFAGVFGVGGAVRGAFLAAYDLPKDVYIFTAGAIGLAVDTGRLATYWSQGAQLEPRLLWALLLFVPVSFAGAKVAERIVQRIPQERFRAVVAAFLALVALKLLVLPSGAEPEQGSRESASRAAQPQLASP
jgi:hypothetical protein